MIQNNDNEPPTYVILDPSSLVRGIGSIRRWIEMYNMVIFIPDYTLRELDFMKKGISLLATNARESIRMIDKLTSFDDGYSALQAQHSGAGLGLAQGLGVDGNKIKATLILQSVDETGPRYEKCLKYKTSTPLIKDFPNYKTEFDNTLVAGLKKASAVKREDVNINRKAEIPARLRYMVRSCVQKVYVEKEQGIDWKIVSEDPITAIWLKSFQLDVINLTQLENILRGKTGDSTVYDYQLANVDSYNHNVENQVPGKKKNKKNKAVAEPELRREKFDTMDYADRGSGELWTP